jgi:hypothetical protein
MPEPDVVISCSDGVAVYEYSAWNGYLLQAMVPGAHRITACIGECSERLLQRIPDSCRVFVFHINLTLTRRVPTDRESLVRKLHARGIATRNAWLSDISKRKVQEFCTRAGAASVAVTAKGDPDELVIVKTTYNYHGLTESALTAEQRGTLGYESPGDMPHRRGTRYRIMARSDVPRTVWSSPHWVVERYVVNAAHRFHRVYLAGDAMVVSRVIDPAPFKKMPEGIERESFPTRVSEALRPQDASSDMERVAALSARVSRVAHVDYGAFDVVSDDRGEPYLIDINATPYWGDGGHPELLAYLAAGLVEYRRGA